MTTISYMFLRFGLILLILFVLTRAQQLPTLYEHYTEGGITEGLKAPSSGFTLNGRPITIYSGAIHYFRVHPQYWRDRLSKARAAGLNAVETYVPWNLHEPRRGVFDFGEGGNDLSLLLDVRRFVQMAQEEDLLVIFRPGPYICSEWEFGGLPSWLLRYEGIKVRTSDPVFTGHVRTFFDQLLPLVSDLAFTKGGPIIALQVENEYGGFGLPVTPRDTEYLIFIRDLYVSHGMDSLYFTSDSPTLSGDIGAIPGELQTANFDNNPAAQFDKLLQLQPDKPLMAMEYWSGWFDHWMEGSHSQGNSPQEFADYLSIIFSYNGSVNFYMFHGGTTYGFMNGANIMPVGVFPDFLPDVSSYDYSAPLSEAGDYTEKYDIAKELIAANNKVLTLIPEQPPQTIKTAYPSIEVTEYIPITDLLSQVPSEDRASVAAINVNSSMENLLINGGNGQSYGLTVYRKQFRATASSLTLQVMGHVRDIAMVLVDGLQRTEKPTGILSMNKFGFWAARNAEMNLTDLTVGENYLLELVVENFGRNNFGRPSAFDQKKGLWEGPVLLDGQELTDWDVIALQLKGSWVQSLNGWRSLSGTTQQGPAMFRARFTLNEPPTDTFLDKGQWSKGCIFVNGFPLGRHFYLGPQITSFIPAPLLKQGDNEIIIFEHYENAPEITFTDVPILELPQEK